MVRLKARLDESSKQKEKEDSLLYLNNKNNKSVITQAISKDQQKKKEYNNKMDSIENLNQSQIKNSHLIDNLYNKGLSESEIKYNSMN